MCSIYWHVCEDVYVCTYAIYIYIYSFEWFIQMIGYSVSRLYAVDAIQLLFDSVRRAQLRYSERDVSR